MFLLNWRKPKPRVDSEYKTPNLFLYSLRRKKPLNLEKPKQSHILMHALKAPPRMTSWSFRESFRMWRIVLRETFRRKVPTVSEEARNPSNREMALVQLRKDSARIKESADLLLSGFVTKVLPHWKKALVAMFLFLPVLEIFLQFTSLLAWPLIKLKQAPLPAKEFVVMCVGDSFTSGKFTSIQLPSYTRFVERVLATKNKNNWKIVNVSSEYLTSEDVLSRTLNLIQKYRPDLMYLMIGVNDIAVLEDKFVFQPSSPSTTRPAFHTEILFARMKDRVSIPTLLDVVMVPPWFLLEKPPVAGYRPEYLAVTDSKLEALIAASSSEVGVKEESEEYASSIEKQRSAWELLKKGLLHPAEQQFQRFLTLDAEDPVSRAGLAETYYEMGMHSEATTQISWLLDRYNGHPNYKNARALLHAFPFENSPNDTSKIVIEVLKKYPKDPWFWKNLADACFLSSRPDYAARAIGRALDLTPSELPEWKAALLRTQADIVARTNPRAALSNLLQAFLLDRNEDLYIAALRKNGPYYLSLNIEDSLRGISCPTETKNDLQSLFHQALDKRLVQTLFSLETRLRTIVLRCQEYRVHPVLVGYPIPNAEIELLNRRVAEETGASWLNLNTRFENILRNDRERKYVDEGRYSVKAGLKLAEWVANDAVSRLEP